MITIEKKATIDDYIKQCKTESDEPLCAYFYNLDLLEEHAKTIKQSLPVFCRLYYAVKANPEKEILKTLEPIVDGFDVASQGEMEKIKSISNKPMLFGGPGKKKKELEAAMDSNVELVNVESFHDLYRMEELAKLQQIKLPVLIRVNLSENVSESHIRMSGVPSQFGVDERDIPQLITEALQSDHVEIRGFHFHAMSNNLDAEAHLHFVESCIQKSLRWKEEYQLNTPIIDIGGGIGINYWDPASPFDWAHFTDGMHRLNEAYSKEDLTLFLEIGRYMAAECGTYVSEVLDVKKNHGKNYAVLRGGSHHLRLPAAWKISHPFQVYSIDEWNEPFSRPGIEGENVTIAGELCTPNDVLVRDEFVESVRARDVILFHYAGAYGWTISHHDFLSHPHPQQVFVKNGEYM
ncbi:type III PLP-dependent enzyme [Halobacillus yeomjeoni]|uniref:Type III PLP-dependent enzyme n=1 Tax=Halobacillus yeomjeoni TaxID=311194 RepID=A0A931HUN8_9BACI|nr:type III PLP-dependent enzyme [Halobacillus yeomjeoni]MBH0229748.1 type III PLP-dependent enzyme [Halobacillus yeomjeoni]